MSPPSPKPQPLSPLLPRLLWRELHLLPPVTIASLLLGVAILYITIQQTTDMIVVREMIVVSTCGFLIMALGVTFKQDQELHQSNFTLHRGIPSWLIASSKIALTFALAIILMTILVLFTLTQLPDPHLDQIGLPKLWSRFVTNATMILLCSLIATRWTNTVTSTILTTLVLFALNLTYYFNFSMPFHGDVIRPNISSLFPGTVEIINERRVRNPTPFAQYLATTTSFTLNNLPAFALLLTSTFLTRRIHQSDP
jgi:hypothetical protein